MSAISHKRTIVFPIPPPGKTNGVCLGRRRWLRRRLPAAPRWTGAGAGSIGSWPGPGGAWRGHRLSLAGSQSAPFEFSASSQGHTRLQARGGGLWGGTPPCRRFPVQGRTRKNDRRLAGRFHQRPTGRRSTSHRRPIFSVPCYPGVTRAPSANGIPR